LVESSKSSVFVAALLAAAAAVAAAQAERAPKLAAAAARPAATEPAVAGPGDLAGPAPLPAPVRRSQSLAGRWRLSGEDAAGPYVGEVRFVRAGPTSYRYERTERRPERAEPTVQERGAAHFVLGRFFTKADRPRDDEGIVAPFAGRSGPRDAPVRRGLYGLEPSGDALAGFFLLTDGSRGGRERLVRVRAPAEPRGRHRIDLLVDGQEMFSAYREELLAAERQISVQTFIYADDSTGRWIAEIMKAKARQGVEVRLLCDASGDYMSREFEDELRAAGVEVIVQHRHLEGLKNSLGGIGRSIGRFFGGLFGRRRPEPPRERRGLFNHDHRKITVVDGRVAFVGGMNISREYEFNQHDIHSRVMGPAVAELEALFFDRWRAAGGEGEAIPVPAEEAAAAAADPPGDLPCEVVSALPGVSTAIKERYLREIDAATDHVYIEMAYFLDDDIIDALQRAEARGVRTLVILPADDQHNVPVVRDAFRWIQNDVVRSGIELYHYPDRMMHSKVATFDGHTATVGSSNLDNMALTLLAEANIFVPDRRFTYVVDRRVFAVDVRKSVRVGLTRLSFWEKLKGGVLHLIRGFL